ncbi:MAG: COR domain-containing protein [Ignavibacteria bacterium]|jgi:hypothetical protein
MDYEHIYKWLHIIEAFGENSPVIIVMSKYRERNDDLNMSDLRKRFPQIVEFVKVDSKDGHGIKELKDQISEIAWKLPQMNEPWPSSWVKVRTKLESETRKWIKYNEYLKLCEEEKIEKDGAETLCNYLHDLGIILCFRDNMLLKNIVIRDPEWATDAVYKILDTQSVKDRDGVLQHTELNKIWNSDIYPENVYAMLLELMNRFELAYELPDKQSHLVAELLPKTEPVFDWNENSNLKFFYKYDFLPAGIITRFIVRTHEELEFKEDGKHLCWREGAMLSRDGARAFVKQWTNEKCIEIKIDGSDKSKRELLSIIRYHFDRINKSIKKVKITKEIPCNCSDDCPKKWDYDNLIKLERKNIAEIICDATGEKVSIQLLLDGYESFWERQKKDKENEQYIERGFEPKIDKEKTIEKQVEKKDKSFFSIFWKIILGLIVLIGGIWTVIQIIESDTFKELIQ